MEKFEKARFEKALERLQGVTLRMTRTTAFLPPLMEAVGGVSVVVVLWYGTWAISRAHDHRFVHVFPGRTVRSLHADQAPFQGQRGAPGRFAAAERSFALLDTRGEIKDALGAKTLAPFKDEIEFSNVSFQYDKASRGPCFPARR